MKFILTIDTEGDNQWDHGVGVSTENIKYVPRFQNLCAKFDIKPTYLVTSEICEDPYAREIFSSYSSKGIAEIGAHLHSWTTPPFMDKDGFRYNDPAHAYATELPEAILKEKIKGLTGQITSAFGRKPTSFRSGRYGFDEKVAKALAENSYLVDSSVTPFTSWKQNKGTDSGQGGPDFMEHSPRPFYYRFDNSSLLEIPVTILPTRFPLNRSEKLARSYFTHVERNLFLKALRKIRFSHQPLWFRPFEWMTVDLLTEIILEAAKVELPYLVMMFHSSELMAGCSIYRKDERSIEQLYDLLERLFKLLQREQIPCLTLTEAAKSN